MACWTASAKLATGPALDGQRDMPLALSLTEGLGIAMREQAKPLGFQVRRVLDRLKVDCEF